MSNRGVQLQIHNLKEVKRELRRAKSQLHDTAFREANKQVSDLMATEARRHINNKSGNLSRYTKAAPTKRAARVKSGSKVMAPYAGRIHYEEPNRKGAMFVVKALKRKGRQARQMYTKDVERILRRLRRT